MAETVTSPANTMLASEWRRWLSNALIFVSPVAFVYLTSVLSGVDFGGLQLNDFVTSQIAVGAIIAFVFNTTL
jgi:hypothetical protein